MEFSFNSPEDLPPQIRQQLGLHTQQEIASAKSAGRKLFSDHFALSWDEVLDKIGACKVFTSFGLQIAQHVVGCNNIECEINHTGSVGYADVSLFIKTVAYVCVQSENLDEPEAKAISSLWSGKDEASIPYDPRYIAFRSAYDGHVVLIGAWKASTKTPF